MIDGFIFVDVEVVNIATIPGIGKNSANMQTHSYIKGICMCVYWRWKFLEALIKQKSGCTREM